MHKLGISVYPEKSSKEEVYSYLELAAKYGFSRIFTCLLSVTESKEEILRDFKEFMDKSHSLGYEVAVDTNPEVFAHLGATPSDLSPFKQMGVDIIRLDGSFGSQKDIEVTRNPYNILIEFNGSMNQGLELLMESGGNKDQCIICHNFFPERYTGIDWDYFMYMNAYWKSLNMRTAAFVSSNNDNTHGPWNVFCGLPTVEIHRGLPIDLQARHILATGDIDDIIIGNAYATEAELKSLSEIDLQKVSFRIDEEANISDVEKAIIYDFAPHLNRYDYSSFILRSSSPRVKYKETSIPYRKSDKKTFTRGDVLVVNDNLAHYRGELEIVLTEIQNDGERNLVGRVKDDEMMILELIEPGHHFKIIK